MGRGAAADEEACEQRAEARQALNERIYTLVRQVPKGQVATYGQIAFVAGLPSARIVGRALSTLPSGKRVPWHRIVNSQGRISVRAGASMADAEQARRLRAEGVLLDPSGRVDFKATAWQGPAWAWLQERGYDVEELVLKSGGLRRSGPWSRWRF